MSLFRPSLRYFAVAKLLKRRLTYSIWSVSDRRAPGATQLLLIPSGLRTWPILYKRIESLEPRLVRLRSGKPGFVFTEVEITSLITAASNYYGKNSFNPMSGFVEAARKPKNRLLIALIAVVVVAFAALSFQSKTKSTAEDSKKPSSCSANPFGAKLTKSQFRSRNFITDGEGFKISVFDHNGGLYLVGVKRACDGKTFQGKAWLEKQGWILADRN